MSVIFQSGYTLPAADQPLTHARIAHSRNWLSGGSALASTTAAGYFANAPLNTLTYEKWKPGATSGTWTYTHGSAVTCDYAAIGAHDLGTAGASLTVQREYFQRTNIYIRSQEFDNAAWNKVQSTVTPNAAVAPDGTLTADKLVEDTTTNAHYMARSFDPGLYSTYTLSVYAKADGRSHIQLIFIPDAFPATLIGAFDLVNGVCMVNNAAVTATIENVGDGWFRCAITAESTLNDTATSPQIRLSPSYTVSTTLSNYLGNGASGVFFWGAQLEETNRLTASSEFDNVAWSKPASITVTANTDVAPDGTTTADTLDKTGGTFTYAIQEAPTTSGESYTASVYLKQGTAAETRIAVYNDSTQTTLRAVVVNWANPSLVATDVGGGWWRVTLTFTAIDGRSGLLIYPAGTTTATGTVIAWGAQITGGPEPTSYIPTTTATVTSTWHDVTPFIVPEDDSAIFAIFEPTPSQGWRINIINSTTAPEIAVIKFGTALQMERPIFGGHSPILYARQTIMRMNESETGEYLGRSKWRTYLETNYAWQNLTAAWIKANWPTLQRAIETEPFFLAWRPLTYPEQVVFGRAMGVPIPTNSGTRNLMNVELQMRALSHD